MMYDVMDNWTWGPAKYAEAEIRAVESWVFIDCFFWLVKFETYSDWFLLIWSFLGSLKEKMTDKTTLQATPGNV